MSRVFIDTDRLTGIASAIRAVTGTSSPLSPSQMEAVIASIEDGADIVDRTVASYAHQTLSQVGVYAFCNCTALSSVSLPECTSVGEGAFRNCSLLTEVNLPECTVVGNGAFGVCLTLSSVSLPKCASVYAEAFARCTALSSLALPACSTIGASAFEGCVHLAALDLTEVTSVPTLVDANAFGSTPIGGYSSATGSYGSIYVPASLYDGFMSASEWSPLSDRMVSVGE